MCRLFDYVTATNIFFQPELRRTQSTTALEPLIGPALAMNIIRYFTIFLQSY